MLLLQAMAEVVAMAVAVMAEVVTDMVQEGARMADTVRAAVTVAAVLRMVVAMGVLRAAMAGSRVAGMVDRAPAGTVPVRVLWQGGMVLPVLEVVAMAVALLALALAQVLVQVLQVLQVAMEAVRVAVTGVSDLLRAMEREQRSRLGAMVHLLLQARGGMVPLVLEEGMVALLVPGVAAMVLVLVEVAAMEVAGMEVLQALGGMEAAAKAAAVRPRAEQREAISHTN